MNHKKTKKIRPELLGLRLKMMAARISLSEVARKRGNDPSFVSRVLSGTKSSRPMIQFIERMVSQRRKNNSSLDLFF